jgi:hypothetical protein
MDVVEYGAGCRELIATGDLHDHPVHFAALVRLAGLDGEGEVDGGRSHAGTHITFHELIHSDRLIDERDMSYRVLARVAWLKAAHPERVHVLLANHELAQIAGQGVMKNGVNCVKAFNAGVEYVFGDDAGEVLEAVGAFISAMPLGLKVVCGDGRAMLCAHSLPEPDLLERFDAGVLERALTVEDYAARRGSAHLMVWGRGQSEQEVEDLAARWGVETFVLGHELAETGARQVARRAVVLNSDHARGVYCRLDAARCATAGEVVGSAKPLGAEAGW